MFNRTRDYLHCTELSLRWVKALFDWNDKIAAIPPRRCPAMVLQGDKDHTVDWRYNTGLIREKCPYAQIELISGARHELFNEAIVYKQVALKYIRAYFEEPFKCQ